MSVETNIVGRFANCGIVLEGTASSLLHFAGQIERLKERQTFNLRMPAQPAFPYSGYLISVEIELGDGNVNLSRNDDRVYIVGSTGKLQILAQNITNLALQESRYSSEHSHIEHFPGHFFLREGSEPLVLTRVGGPGYE